MTWTIGVLFLVVAFGIKVRPPVYPKKLAENIAWWMFAGAGFFSVVQIPISPAAAAGSSMLIGIGLVALSAVPPFLGLVESRSHPDGQKVFSTGQIPDTVNRFPGHLGGNLAGAVAAAMFLQLASSTPGIETFIAGIDDSPAFNIILPISVFVIYLFVRAQQVAAALDVDESLADAARFEKAIVGYSLSHWHQFTNVIYLILVTFTASTSVVYLFAFSVDRFAEGNPLHLTWPFIFACSLVLGFLLFCGTAWSNKERTVYLTFLTGTPAVLVAITIWLSMFADDPFRNVASFAIVGSGYIAYCILAIIAEGKGKVHWHHFSALGMALVLAILLVTTYFD